jgi:hypothetical protein
MSCCISRLFRHSHFFPSSQSEDDGLVGRLTALVTSKSWAITSCLINWSDLWTVFSKYDFVFELRKCLISDQGQATQADSKEWRKRGPRIRKQQGYWQGTRELRHGRRIQTPIPTFFGSGC